MQPSCDRSERFARNSRRSHRRRIHKLASKLPFNSKMNSSYLLFPIIPATTRDQQALARNKRYDKLLGDSTGTHCEFVSRRYFYLVNFVESLVQNRRLNLFENAPKRRDRHLLFRLTLGVSSDCVAQRRAKEISHHFKSCIPRTPYISGAIDRNRIRVVDHKRLPRREARRKKQFLAAPGLQHIKANAHMSVKKTRAVEARFAGTGNTGKNHRFHGSVPGLRSDLNRARFGNFASRGLRRTAVATGT